MTRQEEIKEMAKTTASHITSDKDMQVAFADALRRGAEWADAHPHWISVFDDTPKVDMLILVVHLGKVTTFLYQYERAEVLKNVFGITHWMPLPQAPM